MTPIFERIAIIGIGLIGSSIAHAARADGAAGEVVLTDVSAGVRERAAALALGRIAPDNASAVADADLVVVCAPVGASAGIAAGIAPHLKPGAIVSDVGSVKGAVVAAMAPHLPAGTHFVPAHPVAGTEHSGPDAGFAALFRGRYCIITPPRAPIPGRSSACARSGRRSAPRSRS